MIVATDSSFLHVSNLLDTYLKNNAAYVLEVGRDDGDSYNFQLDRIDDKSTRSLNQNQSMSIVPTGSYWSYFLGLRDIFGIPVPNKKPQWLAIGVETTLEHETRGAYLYLKAFFLPLPLEDVSVIQNIENVADGIYPHRQNDNVTRWNKADLEATGSTIVESSIRTASAYAPTEAWIIRQAIHRYRDGMYPIFRTLAMKKAQVPSKFRSDNYFIVGKAKRVSRNPAFTS